MTETPSSHSLRGNRLHIVLACAATAVLGGCSTFGGWQGESCRSNSWPTQVMGSVQRVHAASGAPESEAEPEYPPPAERKPQRVAEYWPEAVSAPAMEEVEEGTRQLPKDSVPAAEARAEPLAETSPTPLAETRPEPAPSARPAPASPAEPPSAAQSPKVEEKTARVPEPVPPPALPPEVVKACGPTDTACQEELAALLADPLHKWIREKATERSQTTGARLLAYRVLTPVLACDDLRQGRQETEAAIADTERATPPEAAENHRSTEWIQLLRRAVNLELTAEIEKRC
jgi:hypothetical protein